MAITVRLAWPARAALQTLSPAARERLDDALDRIREGHANQDPQARPFRSGDGEELFLFPADDDLCVVFALSDGQAVVRDIVSREFAGRYG